MPLSTSDSFCLIIISLDNRQELTINYISKSSKLMASFQEEYNL